MPKGVGVRVPERPVELQFIDGRMIQDSRRSGESNHHFFGAFLGFVGVTSAESEGLG